MAAVGNALKTTDSALIESKGGKKAEMRIQMSLDGQQTCLCIEGDIYREHAEVLQAIIGDRVRDGSRFICLDMVGVFYIDCKSLELLANLQAQLETNGVSLVFEHARDWRERLIGSSAAKQWSQ
ncbi:STAS domain-containing protein [Sporomusa carbonis]|uniref:STAS domain-containing protein n=1 Tax=Sporomusa carbonis TaxID=3076075 RepID=UPI003C7ADE1E